MGPDSRDWNFRQGVYEDSNVLASVTSLDQMLYGRVDSLQLGTVVGTKVPDCISSISQIPVWLVVLSPPSR